MQGGGPPCPGPGRGAPVAEGGPASPPGHPPLSGRHARHLLGLLGVPAPRPEVGALSRERAAAARRERPGGPCSRRRPSRHVEERRLRAPASRPPAPSEALVRVEAAPVGDPAPEREDARVPGHEQEARALCGRLDDASLGRAREAAAHPLERGEDVAGVRHAVGHVRRGVEPGQRPVVHEPRGGAGGFRAHGPVVLAHGERVAAPGLDPPVRSDAEVQGDGEPPRVARELPVALHIERQSSLPSGDRSTVGLTGCVTSSAPSSRLESRLK